MAAAALPPTMAIELHLWCSVPTSLEPEAAAEALTKLSLPSLPKVMPGQILFKLGAESAEEAAAALCRLRTVDYAHVLLASTSLTAAKHEAQQPATEAHQPATEAHQPAPEAQETAPSPLSPPAAPSETSRGLRSIRDAVAALSPQQFTAALALWRAFAHASADGAAIAAAAIPSDQLVVRVRGKRGGGIHDFSSDEAKRSAKEGFSIATGLKGSTKHFQLDLLAQVMFVSEWVVWDTFSLICSHR